LHDPSVHPYTLPVHASIVQEDGIVAGESFLSETAVQDRSGVGKAQK
jgi:hypothetical protein